MDKMNKIVHECVEVVNRTYGVVNEGPSASEMGAIIQDEDKMRAGMSAGMRELQKQLDEVKDAYSKLWAKYNVRATPHGRTMWIEYDSEISTGKTARAKMHARLTEDGKFTLALGGEELSATAVALHVLKMLAQNGRVSYFGESKKNGVVKSIDQNKKVR